MQLAEIQKNLEHIVEEMEKCFEAALIPQDASVYRDREWGARAFAFSVNLDQFVPGELKIEKMLLLMEQFKVLREQERDIMKALDEKEGHRGSLAVPSDTRYY